jgi:hypothetical protein
MSRDRQTDRDNHTGSQEGDLAEWSEHVVLSVGPSMMMAHCLSGSISVIAAIGVPSLFRDAL